MAGGILWTSEEKQRLEDMYKNGDSINAMKDKLHRTYGSVLSMTRNMKLDEKYTRTNSPNFKAEYQDYYWCYNKVITEGKMPKEIALETGYSQRVIEKWTNEKYGLSNKTYKLHAKLNPQQYMIILSGTLGDGHIDKREDYPIYIESHAINQKGYLFWKYSILQNLCLSEPKYYEECIRVFNGKSYKCQPSYRFETRTIMQLANIRKLTRIHKLEVIDEFGISLHTLDDGCRSNKNIWYVCLAEWSQEEIEKYISVCEVKFNIKPKQSNSDKRYVFFNVPDSKKIDEIILNNLPNELDIIQEKIFRKESRLYG